MEIEIGERLAGVLQMAVIRAHYAVGFGIIMAVMASMVRSIFQGITK